MTDWTAKGLSPEEAAEFAVFVQLAWDSPLRGHFDRLRGTNLCARGLSIEVEIDYASGRFAADVEAFVEFCLDAYQRLSKVKPSVV
jgi:hypothetical protein